MGASLYCGTTRILVRISLCLGREYLLAIFLVFQFWVLFLLKYMKEEEYAGARERKRERKGRKSRKEKEESVSRWRSVQSNKNSNNNRKKEVKRNVSWARKTFASGLSNKKIARPWNPFQDC